MRRCDFELPRHHLLGFNCVQRVRALPVSLALHHIDDFGLPRVLAPLIHHQACQFVEHALPLPIQLEFAILCRRGCGPFFAWAFLGTRVFEDDTPELFGGEISNLLVAVDDEAEGRELAGPVA